MYAKHLPLHIRVQIVCNNMQTKDANPISTVAGGELPNFKEYRESMETQYLQDLMNLTERNIPRACELSGISRSRLYEMLAKYGLGTVN